MKRALATWMWILVSALALGLCLAVSCGEDGTVGGTGEDPDLGDDDLGTGGLRGGPPGSGDDDDEPIEPDPGFFVGFSQGDGGADRVPQVAEIGANWFRAWIQWRQVEPEIARPELTVEQVRADPGMVGDYIRTHDWSAPDALLTACREHGIANVILVVGIGFDWVLPKWEGEAANPDRLGRQNYLGHLYLHVRAAVERYDGDGTDDAPGGLVVRFWEPEAELNEAFLTAVLGWRGPAYEQALGSAWHDFEFLTDVIRLGNEAVREEDPGAITVMPFHTDIHENFGRFFGYPPWTEAVSRWAEYVDVIGIDAYPNYYRPLPIKGGLLYDRVLQAREISGDLPVMVIETGYPSGPTEVGFDEILQAEYLDRAVESARAAGAAGYLHFTLCTGEQSMAVIAQEDIENLYRLGEFFEQGRVLELLLFALGNLDYVRGHFSRVLQSVETHWGQFRADGTKKPSYDVLRQKVEAYPGEEGIERLRRPSRSVSESP